MKLRSWAGTAMGKGSKGRSASAVAGELMEHSSRKQDRGGTAQTICVTSTCRLSGFSPLSGVATACHGSSGWDDGARRAVPPQSHCLR
jgi:hypothetical protein